MERAVGIVRRVHYDELYFHLFGDYCLYINARALVDADVSVWFRKSRQIWRKLYKNAVVLNRANYPRDRFSLREQRRVLFPSAEKLFMRKANSVIFK